MIFISDGNVGFSGHTSGECIQLKQNDQLKLLTRKQILFVSVNHSADWKSTLKVVMEPARVERRSCLNDESLLISDWQLQSFPKE